MGQVSGATTSLRHQWTSTANAIGSAATRITAAIAGIGAYAAKEFSDFEDAITEVGAITRTLGTRDFARLRDAAIDMGEKTRYSATEAAGALKQLALAGLGADQSIQALPPTLQLAAAAGISISTAASVAAKTMKAMGFEASQLAHVNDVLVSTFTRSNTDLLQLAEGLKHAAPLSHALGVSLEDTTAILAKLADAGFQGEMGGTALRNIMSRLAGAMPKAIGELSRMGITTLDTTGKMRPLLDVLEDIENKSLSAGEVMKIFGQRGGPQLLALLEHGIKGIREFSEETKKAGGRAEEMMRARMATMKGQWDELMSVIQTTWIDIGAEIAPILKNLVNETEKWIRANKVSIVKEMGEVLRKLIDTLRDVLKWITENKTQLYGAAEAVAFLIKWIGELVAQYPLILQLFAAFQVSRLLGVNAAVYELTGLIGGLIRALYRAAAAWAAYSTAAKAAGAAAGIGGAASGVGGAAGAAGGVAGAGGLAVALAPIAAAAAVVTAALIVLGRHLGWFDALAVKMFKGVNEKALAGAFERAQAKFDERTNQKLAEIMKVEDPQERKNQLAAELLDAERESRRKKMAADEAGARGNPEAIAIANMNLNNQRRRFNDARRAISANANDGFGNILNQVADKETRRDFADQMKELTQRFEAGKDSAEEFQTAVDKLSIHLGKAAEDAQGSAAFQALNRTRRQMEEGVDQHTGQPLIGGASKGVNFKNVDNLKVVLGQLAAVDKLWADELAKKANAEMSAVAVLRRTGAAWQKIMDAESFLNRALLQLANDAHRAVSATVNKKLTAKQKEQGLQRRKDATAGYEDFEEQYNEVINTAGGLANGGLENIGRDVIKKLAAGIEGATPELQAKFVEDFMRLKEKGPQAFMAGIEELTLQFVEDAEFLKKNAEELAEAMKELTGPDGLEQQLREMEDRGIRSPAISDQLKDLKGDAKNGTIDAAEFGQRAARIQAMADAARGGRDTVDGIRKSIQDQVNDQANSMFGDSAGSQKAKTAWVDKLLEKLGGPLATAADKFNKELEKLQNEFANSDMSTDEFNRRLQGLQQEMDNAAAAASRAAAAEQRKQIANGNFSSLDPRKEMEDRWFAFNMQRWNGYFDAMFQNQLAMMGLTNVSQNLQQGFQQLGNGINRFSNGMTEWYEHNFGGGGGGGGYSGPDISGGVAAWQSVTGKISSLINQISGLNQVLQLRNVTESRKEEVRKQMDALQQQLNALRNPPPPMFVGTGYDPFFRDPGVITDQQRSRNNGGGASGGGVGRQGGGNGGAGRGITINNHYPNVTKINVPQMFDDMEREAKRRGKRLA